MKNLRDKLERMKLNGKDRKKNIFFFEHLNE